MGPGRGVGQRDVSAGGYPGAETGAGPKPSPGGGGSPPDSGPYAQTPPNPWGNMPPGAMPWGGERQPPQMPSYRQPGFGMYPGFNKPGMYPGFNKPPGMPPGGPQYGQQDEMSAYLRRLRESMMNQGTQQGGPWNMMGSLGNRMGQFRDQMNRNPMQGAQAPMGGAQNPRMGQVMGNMQSQQAGGPLSMMNPAMRNMSMQANPGPSTPGGGKPAPAQ